MAGWFLTLRWGTILCQVTLFVAVHFLFDSAIPGLVPGLIAFEIASNLLFAWFIREKKHVPVLLTTFVMFLDITLLTVLLSLTGGAMNPFTFLYLIHIAVGSILLPKVLAWCLAIASSAFYGMLFWPGLHYIVAGQNTICHSVPTSPEFRLHLQGMWLAFAITSMFIVFFVTRIQRTMVTHQETVLKLREEQFNNERLAALAALTAGAAHELATPLSTIAVASGELCRDMHHSGNLHCLEDLHLIRSQVSRCRDILYQMAGDSGEPMGESMDTLTVKALIDEVHASLHEQVRHLLHTESNALEALVTIPRRSVKQVLRGLVTNGFQASATAQPVVLRIDISEERLLFEVKDQGQGMDQATVALSRQPFFTTKPVGQGLGLGLYLAAVLAERFAGALEIDSIQGMGTTVRFSIQVH